MDIGISADFKQYISSNGLSLDAILQKVRVYLIQLKEKNDNLTKDKKQGPILLNRVDEISASANSKKRKTIGPSVAQSQTNGKQNSTTELLSKAAKKSDGKTDIRKKKKNQNETKETDRKEEKSVTIKDKDKPKEIKEITEAEGAGKRKGKRQGKRKRKGEEKLPKGVVTTQKNNGDAKQEENEENQEKINKVGNPLKRKQDTKNSTSSGGKKKKLIEDLVTKTSGEGEEAGKNDDLIQSQVSVGATVYWKRFVKKKLWLYPVKVIGIGDDTVTCLLKGKTKKNISIPWSELTLTSM